MPWAALPERARGAGNWKWSTAGVLHFVCCVIGNGDQNSLRFSPRASSARRAATGSFTLLRKIMAAMM